MKKLSKKWWRNAKLVLPLGVEAGTAAAQRVIAAVKVDRENRVTPGAVRQIIAAMKIADRISSGDSDGICDDLVRDLTAGPLSPDIALTTVAQ